MISYKELDCGIKLVTDVIPEAESACIGFWIGAGSRCETENNSGVSHFIEHMFFKGTKDKSALELALEADNIGASVNAFTGKEATCYHIKSLTEVFPKATEVLLDMLCNSIFEPAEMDKERNVILEEMQMVQDTPDEYVMDVLTGLVFSDTPMAKDVIGTRKSLAGIDRGAITAYIETWYKKDNLVVSVVGNFDERTLINQLNVYLSGLEEKSPEKEKVVLSSDVKYKSLVKDIGQSHIALGIPTIDLHSEDYYAQAIVSDVLGGSMSSRLFQNVREKLGLCYTIYSAPLTYESCGMFYIYAGISMGSEKAALDAVSKELKKLSDELITKEQLEIVKQRLKSSYIFSIESMSSRMRQNGRIRLLLGRDYTPRQTMDEIDAVTMERVEYFCRLLGDISAYSGAVISGSEVGLKQLIG